MLQGITRISTLEWEVPIGFVTGNAGSGALFPFRIA